MIRQIVRSGLCVMVFVWLVYLLLPEPKFEPLPSSLLSDEPGDTVEISGVWAYYTNIPRSEVVEFYRKSFSKSGFLGLPMPVVVLSHPPEYGREAIRDTTETTFLYELVHPFKDSLYINGWDPAEDPDYKNANPAEVLEIKGQFWERKIILRYRETSVLARLIMTVLTWLGTWVVGWHLARTGRSLWKLREKQ